MTLNGVMSQHRCAPILRPDRLLVRRPLGSSPYPRRASSTVVPPSIRVRTSLGADVSNRGGRFGSVRGHGDRPTRSSVPPQRVPCSTLIGSIRPTAMTSIAPVRVLAGKQGLVQG